MITFSPSIYRHYIGLFAAIAAMLLHRTTLSHNWHGSAITSAAAADMIVIAVLMGVFYLFRSIASDNVTIQRLNIAVHAIIILVLIIVVVASQGLFIKTGELLDYHVIAFFMRNVSDLAGAIGSELSVDVLVMAVIVLAMVFFSNLSIKRKSIHQFRNAALALPIVALPLNGVFFSSVEAIEIPVSDRSKSLYHGVYKDFEKWQRNWNKNVVSHWKKGILTGVYLGPKHGKLEYLARAGKSRAERVYVPPIMTSKKIEKPPNIVLIIMESVRHDMLGIYNSGDEFESNTPFVDTLGRDGIVVEKAYTTVPHTSKALVGIYCGSFPEFTSRISEAVPGNLGLTCLPEVLLDAGYASAHFQTAPEKFENRGDLLRNMGFQHYTSQKDFIDQGWERFAYLGLDDRAMLKPSIRWMLDQKKSDTPFFASLLTVVSHHPYASPGNVKPVTQPDEAFDMYAAAVQYTDNVVEELVREMRRTDLLDNTIIVITGDHGEAFAEHGQIMHNGVAYEEGMRIPLLLYADERRLGATKVEGLRQHIDIMPTILDMAGIEYKGRLPGKSLLTESEGHKELLTSCFYTDYCLNYYTENGVKLSYYYGKRDPEMYDLNQDPGESNNLFAEMPEETINTLLYRAARLRNSYEYSYGKK